MKADSNPSTRWFSIFGRRRRRESNGTVGTPNKGLNAGPGGSDGPHRGGGLHAPRNQWTIEFEDLKLVEKIAAGGSGVVWRAEYCGFEVAVKSLFSSMLLNSTSELGGGRDSASNALEEFLREATSLSKLSHPYIIKFYGVSCHGRELLLVTELCACSLRDVIHHGRDDLRPRLLVQLLSQQVQGMSYIHANRMIHRDLKPDNVLLDKSNNVRICDFGLTRENKNATLTQCGTPMYMAPELLMLEDSGHYTEAVDVFSFAMIVWEIFHRKNLYENVPVWGVPHKVAKEGMRPAIITECPTRLRSIITRCWAANPHDRPSFDMLSVELRAMGETLQSELHEYYTAKRARARAALAAVDAPGAPE